MISYQSLLLSTIVLNDKNLPCHNHRYVCHCAILLITIILAIPFLYSTWPGIISNTKEHKYSVDVHNYMCYVKC